jgi:cytochrome c5
MSTFSPWWRRVLCIAAVSWSTLFGAQALPEGEGKAVVVRVCSGCHEVGIVSGKQMSKSEWSDVVDEMREKGANASDKEAEVIVNYLVKYFGKDERKLDAGKK